MLGRLGSIAEEKANLVNEHMNFFWASFSFWEVVLEFPLTCSGQLHTTPFICFFHCNFTLCAYMPFLPNPANTFSLSKSWKFHLYHKTSLNQMRRKWIFCSPSYILGCNNLKLPDWKGWNIEICIYMDKVFLLCNLSIWVIISVLNCVSVSSSTCIILSKSVS